MCRESGSQGGCIPEDRVCECGFIEREGWRGGEYGCGRASGLLLSPEDKMRDGARRLGAYKLFWMGCDEGIHSVGMLVADRWIEKVLDVKCVRD